MSHRESRPVHDGEMGNFKGTIFDSHVSNLLRQLVYKEIIAGRYGVDLIGEFDDDSDFLKPIFSPDRNTVFEFTSNYKISESDVDELAGKLVEIPTKYNISGGILVCDVRVQDNIFKYGKEKGVYIWDFRDLTFLATKISIRYIWSNFGKVLEKSLSDNSTYLWVLEKNPVGIFRKAKVGIFFHDPLINIDSNILDENIKLLSEKIIEFSNDIGILPIQIDIQIHSRGFLRKDAYSKIDSILKKYSNEEKLAFKNIGVATYYVGPWNGISIQNTS